MTKQHSDNLPIHLQELVLLEERSPRMRCIIENLTRLFLDEGFLHFRTDDLAKRLRCSKHTLYALAPTREELFELIIERFYSSLRQAGDAALAATQDRIEQVAGYLNAGVNAVRAASPNFIRDLNRFDRGRRRLRHHQRVRIAGLEKIVAAGIREGIFAPVHSKLVAEFMIHSVIRMSDARFLERCDLSVSEAHAEFYQLFLHGLIKAPKHLAKLNGAKRSSERPDPPRKTRTRAS
jgi:AcrR family transcriptional regulator